MAPNDPPPPVSEDDFPEFAQAPRQTPPAQSAPRAPRTIEKPDLDAADNGQEAVDAMIERLRRERAEGKR